MVRTRSIPNSYSYLFSRCRPLDACPELSSSTIELSIRPRPLPPYWDDSTAPLLFAAHSYSGNDEKSLAISRLALAFHPMMKVFVRHHLATRQTGTRRLPPWMVLFGLVYDTRGFQTIAFYPTWDGDWQPRAVTVGSQGRMMFTPYICQRLRLVACLQGIQAHYTSVLQHLQSWPGYAAAARECSRLLPLAPTLA